jgi:hypothetical protein
MNSSTDQLRAKSIKTMVACEVGRALADFAETGDERTIVGQSTAARGFD